jgi:2-polyprenyl-6-methoxyphenol hydroxylase-like FAD-dependent oxidoreductase
VGQSYIESRIQPDNSLYKTTAENMGRGSTISIGSRQLVISQKQGDGSYRIYFGFDVAENAFRDGTIDLGDIDATRRLLLSTEHFADWAEQYKELIRHATNFRSWPLYSLPKEAVGWKSVPSVTLAGDAAHIAIPGGEGVNLAMTDALDLATKIAEFGTGNLGQAVQEYETVMFPRGVDSITQGSAMGGIMFSEDHQPFVQLMNSFTNAEGETEF